MLETLRMEVLSVSSAGLNSGAFLTLTDLHYDRALLDRLPPDLLQRYHALPVAEDNGRITVAMADPSDRAAREGIIAALAPAAGDVDGPSRVYIVQGDRAAIDAILAQIRPGTRGADSGYLLHVQATGAGSGQDASLAYGEALARLLGLRLISAAAASQGAHPGAPVLAVVPWTGVPDVSQLLAASAAGVPGALLIARQPHWPLRRLLAVIRGEEVDAATVDWVIRLAEPSGAAVTVLAVVPPSAAPRAAEGMPALLTARTTLGRRTRQAAQRLAALQAEGRLHLCQGAAEVEIERELREAAYDLLIVGTKAEARTAYWRAGQLIEALLQHSTCPMLIVKSATPESRL
jgi:nucleotide-binding universal stress UspA family protein